MIETLAAYTLATVLQVPFHLALASPWLVAAALAAWLLRNAQPPLIRLLWVSFLVAVGVAPAYGFHLSMVPVYTLVIGGVADLPSALTQIVGTWVILLVAIEAFKRYVRSRDEKRTATTEV